MIGAGEITKRASKYGVDARTVERDYVLAHVAVGVAAAAGPRLVLKGGTSLRLAHFVDYRFSADLDYSAVDLGAEEALALLRQSLEATKGRAGMTHLGIVDDGAFNLEYVGPLNAKPRTIKVDLAFDERVFEPEWQRVVVAWRDLDDHEELLVYSLKEVCAEKLRCVMQRRQCRDLYDLWVLVEQAHAVTLSDVWPLFEKKARGKGLDPRQFFTSWRTRETSYRAAWTGELGKYIGNDIPDIDAVLRQLNRRMVSLADAVRTPHVASE